MLQSFQNSIMDPNLKVSESGVGLGKEEAKLSTKAGSVMRS